MACVETLLSCVLERRGAVRAVLGAASEWVSRTGLRFPMKIAAASLVCCNPVTNIYYNNSLISSF